MLWCLNGSKSLQQVQHLEETLKPGEWRLLEQHINEHGFKMTCSMSYVYILFRMPFPLCLSLFFNHFWYFFFFPLFFNFSPSLSASPLSPPIDRLLFLSIRF